MYANFYQISHYLMVITLLITFLACESNDDYENYEGWDVDANQAIDDEEFYNGITATGYYSFLDFNADESVSDEEFLQGFYQVWDTDGDGLIDEAEWKANLPEQAPEFEHMQSWDIDQQEGITFEEFAESLAGTEFYQRLDENMDREISQRELSQGLYYLWDNDGDGYIETAEYEEWYDKYYD
jgi:Ca2+-binding EF-hand superfamily protein